MATVFNGYVPGHSAVVAYGVETGGIGESANGVTAATFPTLPATIHYIGYTNAPEIVEKKSNKKGFGLGSPYALYSARGRQVYDLSLELRLGSLDFLTQCVRDPESGLLPNLALYVGVLGEDDWAVYRLAACDQLSLAFQEGEAQELTATVKLKAIAKQTIEALEPTDEQLFSLGTPLMWHDVRSFSIGADDYRQALMGLTVSVANGLELKGERPNWGDDEPLSRTAYQLLPHLVQATGEVNLHSKLSPDLLTTAALSHDWGNIVIGCTDAPGLVSGAGQKYKVTLAGVMPDTITQRGTDPSAQMSHTVSVVAGNVLIELV